jgi:hypothetical protein
MIRLSVMVTHPNGLPGVGSVSLVFPNAVEARRKLQDLAGRRLKIDSHSPTEGSLVRRDSTEVVAVYTIRELVSQ